ncbi:MAG TPA: hypothetical protein VK881_09015 [bacterium]|nr:hypothetical protein [bacterium]
MNRLEMCHRMLPRNPAGLLTKGFWAVMDQGLFAVSNFLLNVLLARWLPPKEYGAFTIAFTVFLLLGTAHEALLTEPMLVFGPSRYKERRSEYLRALLGGHWGLVIAGSLFVGICGGVIGASGPSVLASALLGFAAAGPVILLLWFMRRACYMRLEPHLAASGGLVYLVLMVIGLFELSRHGWLSIAAALWVMGSASLITSLWLAARLRLSIRPSAPAAVAREVLRDHWGYGRWSAATMGLVWLPGNIYYLLLPVFRGLEASGTFKALTNLILPVQHVYTAMAILLVPALVRARGEAEFGRLTSLTLALVTAGSLAYCALLIVFHHPIMAWMYGGQYEGYIDVLWMLGFVLVASGAASILSGALRALERPDQVFWAYGLSTVAVLTFGLWATVAWGVVGAGLGLALSSAARAAAMWAYYHRSGGSHAAPGIPRIVGATHVL